MTILKMGINIVRGEKVTTQFWTNYLPHRMPIYTISSRCPLVLRAQVKALLKILGTLLELALPEFP